VSKHKGEAKDNRGQGDKRCNGVGSVEDQQANEGHDDNYDAEEDSIQLRYD